MTQIFEATEQPVIDLEDLFLRLEGDQDLLHELFCIFSKSAPQVMSELHGAVEQDRFDDIRRYAYTLKGMSATLACMQLKASATRVERIAAFSDSHLLRPEMKRLERELSSACSVLEKACLEAAA